MKRVIQKIFSKTAKSFFGTGIGKNKMVHKSYTYFTGQLKPDFVEIDGFKYFLDEKDSLGLSVSHIHEKTETGIIKKEIQKGDIVIDVGAHIGYHTLIFAKLVGKEGRVYAFEANYENFKILQKNVRENNFENVICENKIISDKVGKVEMFSLDSSTANRLFDEGNNKKTEVESISLDQYFKEKLEKVDFVKLDIQGAEPLAVKGMEKIMDRNPKMKILQEWWPDGIKKLGNDPEKYLIELEDLNYKIIEIDDVHQKLIKTTSKELMSKYPNKQIQDINLFCTKDDKKYNL